MPNQNNKLRPHRSGEWTWSTEYPEIGPELKSGAFYSADDDPVGLKQLVEEEYEKQLIIEKGKLLLSRLWINDPGIATSIGSTMKGVPYWLDAMLQYVQAYDETKQIYLDHPLHNWASHPADVHRYAALVEDQMINDMIDSRVAAQFARNEARQVMNSSK